MQATGPPEGLYYCEIFLKEDGKRYGKTHDASWEELRDMMNRFSEGEDRSMMASGWEEIGDDSQNTEMQKLIAWIILFVVAAVMVLIFMFK